MTGSTAWRGPPDGVMTDLEDGIAGMDMRDDPGDDSGMRAWTWRVRTRSARGGHRRHATPAVRRQRQVGLGPRSIPLAPGDNPELPRLPLGPPAPTRTRNDRVPLHLPKLLANFVVARQNGSMVTFLARLLAGLALLLGATLVTGSPALADEPGETHEGYLLVQQALGHLAHDTSAEGREVAMEKVSDALETDEQEGVDVPTLERAMAALEAEDVEGARSLLLDSIAEALHDRPPATGMDSGTSIVRSELEGRSGLAGEDWGFLAAALGALLLGAWLSVRFRPHDSIRVLRTQLAGADRTSSTESQEKGSRP